MKSEAMWSSGTLQSFLGRQTAQWKPKPPRSCPGSICSNHCKQLTCANLNALLITGRRIRPKHTIEQHKNVCIYHYRSTRLSVNPSVHPSICLSIYASDRTSTRRSLWISTTQIYNAYIYIYTQSHNQLERNLKWDKIMLVKLRWDYI